MMKKYLPALKYGLFFGLGVLLFYLLYRNQDWEKMKKSIVGLNYGWIGVCFVVNIFSHYVRGLRWNMLIQPLGYKPGGFHTFLAVMIGYFANLAVPRMGEVSRCVVLNRTDKVPVDKLVGTVVTERLFDTICLLILMAVNFALEFSRLQSFINDTVLVGLHKKLDGIGWLPVLSIGAIGLLFAGGLAFFLHRKFQANGLYQRLFGVVKGFFAGMQTVWAMKNKWLFLVYTFTIWLMYFLSVYFCFYSLHVTEHLGVLAALTVLVLGSLGFVAPVQGGVGAYHFMVLQALLLYGISVDGSNTFALVAHSFQTLAIIVVGGICFLVLGFVTRRAENGRDQNLNEEPQEHPSEALQP